ncbi:MAG: DUF4838 domain-containing protein [Phycisphaeraceae bacterium]
MACLFMMPAPAAAQQYGNRIVTPAEPNDRLRAAIDDLTGTLERMSGAAFATAEELGEEGIVLARAADEAVPADMRQRLADHRREAFVLRSDGDDRLWIVANHDMGLSHGIYFYLEQLGCRWYLPNPNWELIPERDDITLEIDRLIAPAFISRDFFGTGGFGPRNPVDPKLEMRDRWSDWKRRNRMGQQLRSYGHVGHHFSRKYEQQLRDNPEYRAEVDGERVDYRVGMKFCIANDEVRQLFIEDRLEEMRRRVEAAPDDLQSHFVGVGPADGGGHCECDQCLAIGSGSISDRVFFLANETARAVADEFPGRGVSTYAYDSYAAVPTIDLEPNVHVWVIPYAFQRTGLSGDELLGAWMRKIERDGLDSIAPPGLYTYWNITDWGRNLPKFDFRNTPRERIRFWHEQGVGALKFESTYSGGAIALAHYVGSRLMWDPAADSDALIDEFYQRCFGSAAEPMQRMLERWTGDHPFTKQELALSFRDLEEAHELAESDAVRARVGDYVRYVQYLRRYHEFTSAATGSDEHDEAARALARLVWRIYPSAMVQTYRLWQLVGARFAPESGVKEYFNPKNPEAPEWQEISAPTDEELREWVAAGRRDYPPLDFEPRRYTGELTPIDDSVRPTGEFVERGYSTLYGTKFYFRPLSAMSSLPVMVKVRDWKANQQIKVVAHGPDGQVLLERTLTVAEDVGEWHTLRVPVKGPGEYRVETTDQKNGHAVRVPAGVPMAFEPFVPHGWHRVYFYVPKGLKKLAMYNVPRNVPAILFDPDGNETELEQDGPLVLIDIPQGQDGRVWSLRRPGSSNAVRLLNAPSVFSLSPETLMVPADALAE